MPAAVLPASAWQSIGCLIRDAMRSSTFCFAGWFIYSVCQTFQGELRLCNGRCGAAARDAYFVVGWWVVMRYVVGERMGRYVLDVYFCLLITCFACGQQQQQLTVHSIQVLWEWVRVCVCVL